MPSSLGELPDTARSPRRPHAVARARRRAGGSHRSAGFSLRWSAVLGVLALALCSGFVAASPALGARPSAEGSSPGHAATAKPLKHKKHRHQPVPTTTTTTTTVPPLAADQRIGPGSTGPEVVAIQKRLIQLGYWIGTPDGYYGYATIQAVFTIQKVADLPRDGIVGGEHPGGHDAACADAEDDEGYAIEVNLATDVLFMVENGTSSTCSTARPEVATPMWSPGRPTSRSPRRESPTPTAPSTGS